MKRYMIPIVLGVALVLGGVLLYWHFVINQVLDRNGMENPFPPDDTELSGIPTDAALLSLNWSQSAMSFAECFRFDLAVEDGGYVISDSLARAVARYYTSGNWIPELVSSLPSGWRSDTFGKSLTDYWNKPAWSEEDRESLVSGWMTGWTEGMR